MAPEPNQRRPPQTSDRSLGAAALIGRLGSHLVPAALVVVMVEAALALTLYPALGDVLQESWISLSLRLWTVSVLFVLALVLFTAGVAFGLQRYLGSRATFIAGSLSRLSWWQRWCPSCSAPSFQAGFPGTALCSR